MEFDRLITVFSCESGIIRVVAKGVRKISSRRSGHLDLLTRVNIEIEESGYGGIHAPKYVREAATVNAFVNMKANPEYFSAGIIISSFLLRLLPEQTPYQELFALTEGAFMRLNARETHTREILRFYFTEALKMLGYAGENIARALKEIDPQFTLNARRTLGIFSSLESTRSS